MHGMGCNTSRHFRIAGAFRSAGMWAGVAVLLVSAGCQSGAPAWVRFSDSQDVIAYRDLMYPTVYVADAHGVHMAGEGYAMLSRDGRHLLLIKHKLGGESVFRQGEAMSLLEIATRRTYSTSLPRDFPEHDLEVYFQDEPGLFLAVKYTEFCVSWSPAAGWQAAQRPPGTPQTSFQNDFSGSFGGDDKLSNPLVLQPDLLNPRRTVWVHPDGRKVEILRRNDVPRTVGLLVVLSPVALIPGINGYYFWSWLGVGELGKPQPGDHLAEDLDRLVQQVMTGASVPPASDDENPRQASTCPSTVPGDAGER